MNIKSMKRAAREASRTNGTTHQAELNRIAGGHGFTHWGALVGAQPNPSIGYRYNPMHEQNARDLQDARNDKVHILYVAEDIRIAVGHVIRMANTIAMLPPADATRIPRLIDRPAEVVVLNDGLERDWRDMRRVNLEEMTSLQRGTVVFIERMSPQHVTAAAGRGLMIVGAAIPDAAKSWTEETVNQFLTLVIPTQADSQIGKLYSKEDQAIIYATTAVKFVLPQNDAGTISLIQKTVGDTTIKRPGQRGHGNPLDKHDFLRPGDIARRASHKDGTENPE